MAGGGLWHKTLVYFGLADEDEDYEDDTFSVPQEIEPTYRERDRQNVRKIDRGGRRRQSTEFDDIFAEDSYRGQRAPASGQRGGSPVHAADAAVPTPPGFSWLRSICMWTRWVPSGGQEYGWWGRTGQMSWKRNGGSGTRRSSSTS